MEREFHWLPELGIRMQDPLRIQGLQISNNDIQHKV